MRVPSDASLHAALGRACADSGPMPRHVLERLAAHEFMTGALAVVLEEFVDMEMQGLIRRPVIASQRRASRPGSLTRSENLVAIHGQGLTTAV